MPLRVNGSAPGQLETADRRTAAIASRWGLVYTPATVRFVEAPGPGPTIYHLELVLWELHRPSDGAALAALLAAELPALEFWGEVTVAGDVGLYRFCELAAVGEPTSLGPWRFKVGEPPGDLAERLGLVSGRS